MRLRLPFERAAKTDDLSDTVDYPSAMAVAEGVLAGESVRLIEKLADMIAERLFIRFPILREADVEVAKLGVDVGFKFEKFPPAFSPAIRLHKGVDYGLRGIGFRFKCWQQAGVSRAGCIGIGRYCARSCKI